MLIIKEKSILFCGHTHEQAMYLSEGWKVPPAEQGWEYQLCDEKRVVVNPGSVGQQRAANHWKAGYAIYDTEGDKVTFHNIPYDYEKTIRKIMELPEPPVTMKTKQSLAEQLKPQK